MARKPSVILTPAEKKAEASDVKALLKEAKDELKLSTASRKATDKEFTTAVKALEKQYASDVKASDKNLAALSKDIAALEGKLDGLVPKKATPSPTE